MMAIHPAFVFLGGLLVVVLGAELLLSSATRIANMLHVSPIVIGLTVVAIGTSLPELAVGITAAAEAPDSPGATAASEASTSSGASASDRS